MDGCVHPSLSYDRNSTRSMHAYDASRRSKCHARMGRVAQVSGVAHLVGVQRAIYKTVTRRVSLNTWFVKYLQYVHSTVEYFRVLFLFSWLLWRTDLLVIFFVRVASCRPRSALASALDSAKYVRCKGPAALSSPSSVAIKRRPDVRAIRYPAWV